jgi:hypothetical protein
MLTTRAMVGGGDPVELSVLGDTGRPCLMAVATVKVIFFEPTRLHGRITGDTTVQTWRVQLWGSLKPLDPVH